MVALYKKIYKDIKEKIENNILRPGDSIASESQLQIKYKCSRDTVRKATAMLEQSNFIEKSRGKQAIVKTRTTYTFPTSKIESFKELNKKNNLGATTHVILIEETEETIDKLKRTFEKNIKVVRVRSIEGEKVVLDIDYFDADKVSGLTKEVCENSIYEHIETKLGIEIGYSQKIVTVKKPTSEEMKLLDIKEEDLLVNVESYTFTTDNVHFQTTISKHRYDKFSFEAYATRQK